mmetsp:Transcript_5460/g.12624  ORF Transcript_5460/g.12624 Transcript_5460/m.12624 type:complete len:216 (+) Transcript_5460:622-1269(+)
MQLNLVHVDKARPHVRTEAHAVAVGEGSVGGGDPHQVRSVLLHQAPVAVVEAKTTGGENHRVAHQGVEHAVAVLVLHANHLLRAVRKLILDELLHGARGFDLHSRNGGSCCPGVLHDCVPHWYRGSISLGWTAVRSLLRMSAQLRKLREGDAELVDKPVNGLCALRGQHAHAAGVAASSLGADEGIALQEAAVIIHTLALLDPSAAGIDAAGGLG